LICAGASDFKARVFSGYIKGIDDKPEGACSWGSKFPFGEVLAEFPAGGWVHDVSFSPDGETIAFVAHDSTFSVVTGTEGKLTTLKTSSLPFTHLLWVTPKSVVCVGHDANPTLFSGEGTSWKLVEKLDVGKKEAKAGGDTAMSKFREMDSKGQSSPSDTILKTVHQNSISGISVHTGSRASVTKFATTGIDGKLVVWDKTSIEQSISGLKIA